MTDQHAPEPHEDDLVLDAFDGDPEATARVAADARLTARLDDMARARDALRRDAVVVDPAVRSASIAAALDVFDDLHASVAAAARLEQVAQRRRASRRLFGSAGAVAATAAVVVGIVAIGPNLGDSADDSSDVATAEATDFDAAATERGADAEAEAASDARPSSAPLDTQAASEATLAPATSSGAAFTTTTVAAATTAAPDDDPAGDSADDGAVEEPAPELGIVIDERLLECAERYTAEIDPDALRLTEWIGSERSGTRFSDPPLEAWIVLLDSGFELDVVVDAESCDFEDVGEPRAPGTARP